MRRIFPLLLLLAWPGCTRGLVDPGYGKQDGGGPKKDQGRITWVEGGLKKPDVGKKKQDKGTPAPDYKSKSDLPAKAGTACYYNQCGPGLICMANVCEKKCTEPVSGCNAKTNQCPANKTCMWASTFTGACLTTSAKYLQQCGQGKICEQGTLCVSVGSYKPKCLRLCMYGCPSGAPCGITNTGCRICIQ